MSYGGYEARVGTPKLLELLDQLELQGDVLRHRLVGRRASGDGGGDPARRARDRASRLSPSAARSRRSLRSRRSWSAASRRCKRRLGVVPIGYRAPYGEFTEELRAALVRRGIVYTSSFRDDVRPYRHVLADGTPGAIELPVTASYDDWMHGLSARFSPRSIFPERARAVDLEGRARRDAGLGRDGDDGAASAMQRPADAAAPAARVPDLCASPARICGSRPARRSPRTSCTTKPPPADMSSIAFFGSYVLARRDGAQDVLRDHWVLVEGGGSRRSRRSPGR